MPQESDLLDFVSATRSKFMPMKWVDAASRYQDYILVQRWLKKGKDIEVSGGKELEFDIRLTEPGTAQNVGLHQHNPVNVVDMMTKGTVPWRHTENYWVFERREKLENAGNYEKLYDVMKMRREAAMIDLFGKMEYDGWGKPASSADTLTPWGIQMYVVPNATTGFNGGAPDGFTTVAGITPTTNYKNYTATYAAFTNSDIGRTLRLGIAKTHWMSPLTSSDASEARRAIYTTTDAKLKLEEMARDNNDRVGFDIDATGGKTTLNGNPLINVFALDAQDDATVAAGGTAANFIYLIDHEYLKLKVLKGDNLHEHPARELDQRPNTVANYVDITWQMYCENRRTQAVFVDQDATIL